MTVTADDPDETGGRAKTLLCRYYKSPERIDYDLCKKTVMVRGETQYNKMSRFLKEVPLELISTGNKFSGNGKVHRPRGS